MSRPRRIDAHQHFWSLARGDYSWLTPAHGTIYRDFGPSDLLPLLRASGVDGTVLVQAAETVAETEYMLALADAHAFIRGVVGWVDLSTADATATLERLARHPRLKAVRPMLHDLPDVTWIVKAPIDAAVQTIIRLGLRFDALVRPPHLPHLLAFAQRHPQLAIVIDHLAKPEMSRGELACWHADMAALAALPQLHCKLSGMVTELGAGWQLDALRPYAHSVLELFGPRRVIWGSDWPVLNMATDYAAWTAATDALLEHLDADERAAVLGGNAVRFYGLGDERPT